MKPETVRKSYKTRNTEKSFV